jgi:hypothetical protein
MRAAITPFMDLPPGRKAISLSVNLMVGIKKSSPVDRRILPRIYSIKIGNTDVQGFYIIQDHFIGIAWKIFLGARK